MTSAKKICLIAAFILLTAMGSYSPADSDRKAPGIDKREKAADFSLKDLGGRTVSLSSMRGRVVLLNFWATWCPPCVAEMPSLNRLYGQMRAKGLEVIAVSVDRSADDVREFIGKKGFNFTVLMDEGSSVARRYRVFSTPTTFLIDKNGNVVERFFGDYDWQDKEIMMKIEKLL